MEKNKCLGMATGLIFAVLFFGGCDPNGNGENLLSSFRTSKGNVISVYYVDFGATTKQTIQVRTNQVYENKGVIANYEHNYLKESRLLNDTTLFLILKDSGSVKEDTIILQISRELHKQGVN